MYIVAKAPRPGASKTRLCPPLTPEQAARLSRAFLLDTLAYVAQAGLAVRVICRDAEEQAALAPIVHGLAPVCVQAGSGLGAALETAFRRGLADGFGAVGAIGSDIPTLPPEAVRQGFAAIRRGNDVALGPSSDGRYFLLVARALFPQLFRDMVWGTSAVLQETFDRGRAAGLRVHLRPEWYDVDDPASLPRLRADLTRAPAALAPCTRAELAETG